MITTYSDCAPLTRYHYWPQRLHRLHLDRPAAGPPGRAHFGTTPATDFGSKHWHGSSSPAGIMAMIHTGASSSTPDPPEPRHHGDDRTGSTHTGQLHIVAQASAPPGPRMRTQGINETAIVASSCTAGQRSTTSTEGGWTRRALPYMISNSNEQLRLFTEKE
jgi:hypothetical protein